MMHKSCSKVLPDKEALSENRKLFNETIIEEKPLLVCIYRYLFLSGTSIDDLEHFFVKTMMAYCSKPLLNSKINQKAKLTAPNVLINVMIEELRK